MDNLLYLGNILPKTKETLNLSASTETCLD